LLLNVLKFMLVTLLGISIYKTFEHNSNELLNDVTPVKHTNSRSDVMFAFDLN